MKAITAGLDDWRAGASVVAGRVSGAGKSTAILACGDDR